MKTLKSTLLAVCATAVVGGLAVAQSPDAGSDQDSARPHARMMHKHARGGHGMHGAPLMGALRQLDLSDSQRQSIKSIFESAAPQREALRQRRMENLEALAKTMPTDPGYPALIEAQKQIAVDAIQQHSDLHTQVFTLLTPEQQAKVPEVLAERKARMEERRKEWREERRERREADGV